MVLVRPLESIGMKEVREQLHALRDTGARTREVRVGIHGVNLGVGNSRQTIRRRDSLLQAVSARRHDQHLRLRRGYIVPGYSLRIGAGLTEGVFSTRCSDHFRNPVNAAEERLGPLAVSYTPLKLPTNR